MTLYATLKQKRLSTTLTFDKVYVGSPRDRTRLYTWMSSHGYAVTATMTLTQLIDVLVGEAVWSFIVSLQSLIVTDEGATITGKTITLPHGASVNNSILTLEDSE